MSSQSCIWLLCPDCCGLFEENCFDYDLVGEGGMRLGLGLLPTIRMSQSDCTREAKWDSRVLVEACIQHKKGVLMEAQVQVTLK